VLFSSLYLQICIFYYGISKYPDKLKVALVTPIFKGNDDNKFENYRPISALNCFSKLLEKLMIKRLTKFIDKNNILIIETPMWIQKKQINRTGYTGLC
jgi:hypothetical protein